MKKLWRPSFVISAILSFAMIEPLCPSVAIAQAPQVGELTVEILNKVGLRLLPSLPSIRDQLQYQDRTSRHQEFAVEWDSLPAARQIERKEDVGRLPLAPNFKLLERRQDVNGPAGSYFQDLLDQMIVIVAATRTGEVRGLSVREDPRIGLGESFNKAGQATGSTESVVPKATIRFQLPDDPGIEQIIFFKPIVASDGTIAIQRVGMITLSPEPPAPAR